MGNQDIEMQDKPSADGDKKDVSQLGDKPPAPPKRDFIAEDGSMVEEPENKRKKVGSFLRPEVIYKPESSKTCMTCLKNLFIFFNLLIWAFGAVLMSVGIWIKVDKDFWDLQTGLDMQEFSKAGYVLIAAGVIIMLIGFFGCYGAHSQSMWMLIVYAIVVILLILLEIAVMAIVWTASNNKELKDKIKSKAKTAMQDMSKEENKRYFLDLMQSKLKCCGLDGVEDYGDNSYPNSCKNPDTGLPYNQGCLDAMVAYLKTKAGILGGIAIGVFVLQLIAFAVTVILLVGLKHAADVVF